MKVLGIDPGVANCGWALIQKTQNKEYKLISFGEIKTNRDTFRNVGNRLKEIFLELKKILKKYKPDIICIEKQLYSKIAKNTIDTYFAVGVIHLLSSILNIELKEFSPKTVKLSLTGYGSASKYQVNKMINMLFQNSIEIKSHHITDAISVAICYLTTKEFDVIEV